MINLLRKASASADIQGKVWLPTIVMFMISHDYKEKLIATMCTLAILMMLLIRAKTMQKLSDSLSILNLIWSWMDVLQDVLPFTLHSNLSSFVQIGQIYSRCSSREWNVTASYLLHPQGWSYSLDGSCSTWFFSCCNSPHEIQA